MNPAIIGNATLIPGYFQQCMARWETPADSAAHRWKSSPGFFSKDGIETLCGKLSIVSDSALRPEGVGVFRCKMCEKIESEMDVADAA